MEIDLLQATAQVGFPIAVAVYLLYERSKFNEKISVTLDRVAQALERIEGRIK